MAPILSGLVLPGLGQVINRQYIKGLILIALVTILFLAALFKFFLDLTAVMGQVVGPDLVTGGEVFAKIVAAMRERDLTLLYGILIMGTALWAYSIVDAYLVGRQVPPETREDT